MKRERISLNTYHKYDTTPFADNVSNGILQTKNVIKLKKTSFEKQYNEYLKNNLGLTPKTIEFLTYLTTLKRNGDLVMFEISKCYTDLKLKSKPYVYKMIGELVNAGAIAKTKIANAYYFNPIYFNKVKKINIIIETILEEDRKDENS